MVEQEHRLTQEAQKIYIYKIFLNKNAGMTTKHIIRHRGDLYMA